MNCPNASSEKGLGRRLSLNKLAVRKDYFCSLCSLATVGVTIYFAIDSRHFATTERCSRNRNQPLNSAIERCWKRRYKTLCSCPQEIRSLCMRTKCLNKVTEKPLITGHTDFYFQRRFLGSVGTESKGLRFFGSQAHHPGLFD